MKRTILVAAVSLVCVVPMFGDVTIKQSTTGKGMGMAATGTATTYIKGMKMRTELEARGTVLTTIFDVENQKLYTFDSKKKSADVWDMATFSKELEKSVEVGEMKAKLTASGKKKEVAGKSATGYDLEITVPAKMGGEGGMEMDVNLKGPIWVVKDAPGAKDYLNFYKAAAEKGWIFSDPRSAKASPGPAKASAEMYRQLVQIGAIPYESEVSISMSGEGPMAAMMAKMGNMSMTTTVTSIETTALDDTLFAPPAGYKINPKK